MAFTPGRGGSRGGSRGRGSSGGFSRGRGGGSRGGASRGGFSRGGRGGGDRGRGGKRPVFDSARLAQQKEEEENQRSDSESASEEEEEAPPSEEESSDSDDEPLPNVRPYSALIQSLTADAGPQAKRRKLDHAPVPKVEEVKEDAEEDSEAPVEDADEVEEEEEGPDVAIDGLLNDDDDEEEDSSDPFEAHFADPDNNILSQRLEAIQKKQWVTEKSILPNVGKAIICVPTTDKVVSSVAVPSPILSHSDLKLKQKLTGVISKQRPTFDDLEKTIATHMFGYQDILYCERKPTNAENLRRLACLHAVNHVFKLEFSLRINKKPN